MNANEKELLESQITGFLTAAYPGKRFKFTLEIEDASEPAKDAVGDFIKKINADASSPANPFAGGKR